MSKIVITDRGGLDFSSAQSFLESNRHTVTILDVTTTASALAAVADADAIITSFCPITAELIASAPKLKTIATTTVGFDSIDVQAARARQVSVYNLPSLASEEVATHALAGILSLVRGLKPADENVRGGDWDYTKVPTPLRLSDSRLAVIGMGRIASKLVALATPLFGEIVGYDPFISNTLWPNGVERAESATAAIHGANVVSLHIPATPETFRMINHDTLSMIAAGGYLINVSRGSIIDEQALAETLKSGHLAGAFLDVTDPEPPALSNPLFGFPNVLFSPHSGFQSTATLDEYAMRPARTVASVLAGEVPVDAIDQASAK